MSTDSKRTGTLYGVGLGPGDAGLITVKALETLKRVEVIALPSAKVGGSEREGIARGIITELLGPSPEAELVGLYLPMTKEASVLKKARQVAASSLAERLRLGKDVAFVTLGDPLFYSTFSYLVPLCRELVEGVSVEIIPGVTAFSGAAATLGEPLASAEESVAVVPASYDLGRVERALDEFDTVVLMKISTVIDELLELLEKRGLIMDSSLVEKATWAEEEVSELGELGERRPGYFSLIIVRTGKGSGGL